MSGLEQNADYQPGDDFSARGMAALWMKRSQRLTTFVLRELAALDLLLKVGERVGLLDSTIEDAEESKTVSNGEILYKPIRLGIEVVHLSQRYVLERYTPDNEGVPGLATYKKTLITPVLKVTDALTDEQSAEYVRQEVGAIYEMLSAGSDDVLTASFMSGDDNQGEHLTPVDWAKWEQYYYVTYLGRAAMDVGLAVPDLLQ